MATLPFSWQECRLCGGAYFLWGNPSAPLDTDEIGLGERWTEWTHLDGRPYTEADSAACNTCAGLDLESMTAPQRRWGVSLPGVTQATMRRDGISAVAAPSPSGFVVPTGGRRVTRADDHPPKDVADPEMPVAHTGHAVPTTPTTFVDAVPLYRSIMRVFATSPGGTVPTYAPIEQLRLRDPLVWLLFSACIVPIVAIVVGWFIEPGNVPR